MADNKYFVFATEDITDDVSGQANKIALPSEVKAEGFWFKSVLSRNWLNYILNYITDRLNRPVSCLIADLPAPNSRGVGYMLYITDTNKIAFTDGTNWRYVQNNNII